MEFLAFLKNNNPSQIDEGTLVKLTVLPLSKRRGYPSQIDGVYNKNPIRTQNVPKREFSQIQKEEAR
jgi:hypothetical protein